VDEESPEADAGGPGVVAKLMGANLHPWPMGQHLDKGPVPHSWARPHLGCQQGTEEDPNQGRCVVTARAECPCPHHCAKGGESPAHDSPLRVTCRSEGGGGRKCRRPPLRHRHFCSPLSFKKEAAPPRKGLPVTGFGWTIVSSTARSRLPSHAFNRMSDRRRRFPAMSTSRS